MKRSTAEIINEQSFADVSQIGGVSYDGQQVWIAVGGRLDAIDPASGRRLRSLAVTAHAGTAFDGKPMSPIAAKFIQKTKPETGGGSAAIPTPKAQSSVWATGGEAM